MREDDDLSGARQLDEALNYGFFKVEIELLADVIHRHRRMIITKDKLTILTDIVQEDCKLLDDMMTKYSRYEHAQSAEAPVELPLPDELSEDIANLKKWRDALEARRK